MKPGLFVTILVLAVISLLFIVIRYNSANLTTVNLSGSPVITPTPVPNIFGSEVSFSTPDKSLISATIYNPSKSLPPYKSLVLVHQFNSDRSDWSPFISTFLDNNYRVLVYDIRSFGNSTSSISASTQKNFFNSMPSDLEAAVSYLRSLPDTDKEHIGVIGSSIGANIAIINSALNDNMISATVAISPSATQGYLDGSNIANFKPSNIFYITDPTDSSSSQDFFTKSSNPKSIKIYPGPRKHGVELLKDQQIMSDLINYLRSNL